MATQRDGVPEEMKRPRYSYMPIIQELTNNPSRAKTLSYDESPRGYREAISGLRALEKLRKDWFRLGRFPTHVPAFKQVGNRLYIFMVDLKDIPLYWQQCPANVREAATKRRLELEGYTQS